MHFSFNSFAFLTLSPSPASMAKSISLVSIMSPWSRSRSDLMVICRTSAIATPHKSSSIALMLLAVAGLSPIKMMRTLIWTLLPTLQLLPRSIDSLGLSLEICVPKDPWLKLGSRPKRLMRRNLGDRHLDYDWLDLRRRCLLLNWRRLASFSVAICSPIRNSPTSFNQNLGRCWSSMSLSIVSSSVVGRSFSPWPS